MDYVDRIQENGAQYINGLRGEEFWACGYRFCFFFYELHRVAWGVASELPTITVFDAAGMAVEFTLQQAQEYLRAAHELMTERSKIFHG
jgi:hypothetical protein